MTTFFGKLCPPLQARREATSQARRSEISLRACYSDRMTRIEEIKQAIEKLTPSERTKFRAWYEEFEARLFDEQIERDAKEGKLDRLAAEARTNYEAGRCEEF